MVAGVLDLALGAGRAAGDALVGPLGVEAQGADVPAVAASELEWLGSGLAGGLDDSDFRAGYGVAAGT